MALQQEGPNDGFRSRCGDCGCARGAVRLARGAHADGTRRADVHRARWIHHRGCRGPAARRAAHRRRLRRGGAPLCRRVVRIERQGRGSTGAEAASHPAARRRRRRRTLRSTRRLCRSDDAARGRDVAGRLALRRGAAEHLEADRHRWRRRRRSSRGVVRGKDPHRVRQRSARPLSRSRRLDLLDQGRLRAADLRAPGSVRRSSPARRTSSAGDPAARSSSR